ncbi:lysozyme inhibitor LprI family protein [Atopomonas hussainii]|uniref:lysozyme inhibitor LprI family protein n=1 Tax=Atopomonas hussainii TaxID=1429083 RepID=UPI0009F80D0A|nr:lysozyme inhibitor LprI family protein [Atopomonas hussainii]
MERTRTEKLFAALLFLTSGSVLALSQAEYAENSLERWKENEHAMSVKFSQLVKEAEQEPGQDGKEALSNLKAAKAHWEEFRRTFCLSMSETYGGEWESANESDCRDRLTKSFTGDMNHYGY